VEFDKYEIDLNAKCVCGCMEGNRVHKIYRFPNDMGASVVSGPKNAPSSARFRMYVLRFLTGPPENSWEIACDTPLTDDTIDCADWSEVEANLVKVIRLKTDGHIQVHSCRCGSK
jgi:hypothetical protein